MFLLSVKALKSLLYNTIVIICFGIHSSLFFFLFLSLFVPYISRHRLPLSSKLGQFTVACESVICGCLRVSTLHLTPCTLQRMLGVHWNRNILSSCSHIVVVTLPVVSRFCTWLLFIFLFCTSPCRYKFRTAKCVECL